MATRKRKDLRARRATGRATGATGERDGNSSAGTGAGGVITTGEPTGQKESVGVLLVTNEVTLNDQQLLAEADAAVASAPPVAPGGELAGVELESWCQTTTDLTNLVVIVVLPQWNITGDEAKAFSESLGRCLDQAFPGGPAGKYACWYRLLMCSTGIIAGRIIQHGALPPLWPKKADEDAKPTSTKN